MVSQAHAQNWMEQVKGREARPQVLKEESGIQEDAAAKEVLEVWGLKGTWRIKHRVVGEDNSTTFPYSYPSNISLCQAKSK